AALIQKNARALETGTPLTNLFEGPR
ncbi:MAG: hypothetical protein QOH17_1423, partial [Pseudonocardiales bacterium]|nr:hypothetical protein [Pseudonocardiales bacterium]